MNKAVAGDTLYIGAGIYTESLAITRSLSFYRRQHAHGERRRHAACASITVGVDVTLDGLIVASGYLTGADLATSAGAGIYNAGNLTVA